jgi:predicted small secreted protein
MIRMTTTFLLIALLAGCETVEGLGQDVEAGGEAIQRTAEDVQDEP